MTPGMESFEGEALPGRNLVDLGFGGLSATVGDHIGHFYRSHDEMTRCWSHTSRPVSVRAIDAHSSAIHRSGRGSWLVSRHRAFRSGQP